MTASGSQQPLDGSGLEDDDRAFDRIEAALAETERGRRFLAAHARRHRGADTAVLLQAIARLEATDTQEAARHGADREQDRALSDPFASPLAGLNGLAAIVAGLRTEIAAGRDRSGTPKPFETLVQGAGRETSAILAATEAMQEVAWRLRETGAEEPLCDVLDRRATAIYTACAAQDRITQAGLGIARTLSLVETRIAEMVAARSAADASPRPRMTSPVPPEQGIAPVSAAPEPSEAEPSAAAEPAAAAQPAPDDLASAFADLDRLSIEEKIALFS